MIVFLNGQFVAAENATVSVFDRGFLYGDGLFETVPVFNGRPFRWREHDTRLRRGAAFLKLRVPFAAPDLGGLVNELIQRNDMPDSILRLTLSRGVGIRGYSIQGADTPFLVMALFPAPSGRPPSLRLITASLRVPADDALARFKSCSKLPQILARAEAEGAGGNEALLLNTRNEVAETASGNLFWMAGAAVVTPPVSSGLLAGVTRAVLLEICAERAVPTLEAAVGLEELHRAQGVFVTNSSTGVTEVETLDGKSMARSPRVAELQVAYQELVRRECRAGAVA